ncbi:hypothetical protein ACSVH2_02290 [Flavobacterium sp. RSB2_4_14]|uniref:hypothetical protein n=1 Tax=Flavobacterium sp. RSB2_4_14 TaxID=3447665 RepID=UPI003F2E63A8
MLQNLSSVSDYNSLSRKVALLTFLLGGFILALYYLTAYSGMIYISLFFMITFFVLNTSLSIILISLFLKNKKDRKSILVTLFLMFLNVPIGYLFLQIGFEVYGVILNN